MKPVTDAPRVAIAGGGIIGLSCAFALAQAGARVSLFERGEFGGAASGAAAGMLAPNAEAVQDGAEAAVAAFCRHSLTLWPDFAARIEKLSGESLPLSWSGSLIVTDTAEEAADMAVAARAGGGKAEALDREGLLARQAGLGEEAGHGVWLPEEGHVDPRAAVSALVAALRAMDVEIVENASVRGVETRRGALRALRVEHDGVTRSVACDAAVIASGIEPALAGSCPALRLLYPVKGQMLALDGAGVALSRVVRGGAYLIPRADGEIWVGASSEHGAADMKLQDSVIRRLRRAAERLVPALADAAELRRWAGLRPGTRDSLPLIGGDGPEGVFLAAGHYRNGVLAAPATAEAITAMILEGETPELAAPFAPARTSALTRV